MPSIQSQYNKTKPQVKRMAPQPQVAQTIKNVKIPYPTEGIIRTASLDDTVCPENSVQMATNWNFDCIGALTTRPGVANLYTQRGGSITSFGTLNILAGAQKLFSQVATDISVWTGSVWSTVRTTSVSTKARFAQFLGYIWMVNGHGGDAPLASNGGAFAAYDVPATFPKGDFISAGFDGRVWVADASLDALYYTDQIQFTGSAYVSPLTFNLATNFIEYLSPQDGQSITGLCRIPKALLVFKQNNIFRVYSASNVDPYPAYNVGTYSQESIVQAKTGIYFHHSSGFYQFNYSAYNSQPIEISRRVIDFIRAIPRSNFANIIGIFDGFDSVKWSVGPVTVEGVTYANCQMRYSISTQIWAIYDYAANNITAMIRFDDGTTLHQVCGTSIGLTGDLDVGTTDFGQPIFYEMIDRWRSFTDMYSNSKSISGINVFHENAAGADLSYQTEKSGPDVWSPIATLDDNFDSLMPNASTDDFEGIRFRLSGFTTGTPVVVHGIELLSIQNKGFDTN
jgi:hypothetical protein